jgi:hypothetical protein
MLMVESDALLRYELGRTLAKMRLSRRLLQVPASQIRRQVEQEVQTYERIIEVAVIYRQQRRQPVAADEPVMALLRLLMEESVEQIFRLLMLLYRPEDIHLVYEQLRVGDTHLRADAIELLDNLVDPATRAAIFPILDENRFLSCLDEEDGEVTFEPTEAYHILQRAIWDHNSWLSVTVLCAIGQLRLTTMRQELEKAARQAEPLLATAGKVALLFSVQG